MYKVKNVSLVKELESYKVKTLEELTDGQLVELTLKLGCVISKPPLDSVRSTIATKYDESFRSPATVTRYDRINQINSDFGLSIYMGREYWEERHEKQLVDRGGIGELRRLDDGGQTFKLMKDMRVGLFQLLPGDEVELDWTDLWIKEVLSKHPIMTRIELTDLDSNEKITREAIVETKDGKEEIIGFEVKKGEVEISKQVITKGPANLREIPWTNLVTLAKEKGINTKGKNKVALISELSKL